VKLPAALADLPRPLYFFDGYCVLCSGFVAFCVTRDPEGHLKFASAQSALGQRVLRELGLPDGTLDRTAAGRRRGVRALDGSPARCAI
jgi:predicted DCC family thiol-disulfide oxidoreductase YuxK